MVGLASFIALYACVRFLPRFPAALMVLIAAGAATTLLRLQAQGVAVLGSIPAGLPRLRWPTVPLEDLVTLVDSAAGLALVVFTSGTLTARSFAAKGGYQIDVDREFAAFGIANVASALSQGFAVTGADSRTTQSASRPEVPPRSPDWSLRPPFSAVLLFLTEPLQYVPIAALAAVLIFSALSLFDVRTLQEIWRYDRLALALSIVTTLSVVAVGAINGILIAVTLALARFIKQTARPHDEVLAKVEGLPRSSIQ